MKGKKTVTNTSRYEARGDWLMGGNPRAIENQEAKGQREFVISDVLPSVIDDQKALEEMGVKLGDHVEGDDMFRYAQLPAGWKKRATDHSMWSELIDNEGAVRARMFYKAAFYDRHANLTVVKNT